MTECTLNISTIKHLNSEWDGRETLSFCCLYENTSYRRGHINAVRACPFSLLGLFLEKNNPWRRYLKHKSYQACAGQSPKQNSIQILGPRSYNFEIIFIWRSLFKICGNKHSYQSIFNTSSFFHMWNALIALKLFLCNLTTIKATPDERIKFN